MSRVLYIFSICNIFLIILALSFGYRGTSFFAEQAKIQNDYIQAKINSSYIAKFSKDAYEQITKSLPNVLFNEKSRYVIRYPSNWEYKTAKGMVVLKGKEGTPAYFINVNIQTIAGLQSGGIYADANQILTSLKKKFTEKYSNVQFLESGSVHLTELDGTPIFGNYVIFTFSDNGLVFKQWQVIIPRSDGRAFYSWAYTSPLMQYQEDFPTAQQMFKTLNIF